MEVFIVLKLIYADFVNVCIYADIIHGIYLTILFKLYI